MSQAAVDTVAIIGAVVLGAAAVVFVVGLLVWKVLGDL
jgi:hypothetical protein